MDVVSLILLLIYTITILLVSNHRDIISPYILFILLILTLVSSLSPGAHKSRLFSMYSSEEMMWLAEESLTMNYHYVGISPEVVYIYIYLSIICLSIYIFVCLSVSMYLSMYLLID